MDDLTQRNLKIQVELDMLKESVEQDRQYWRDKDRDDDGNSDYNDFESDLDKLIDEEQNQARFAHARSPRSAEGSAPVGRSVSHTPNVGRQQTLTGETSRHTNSVGIGGPFETAPGHSGGSSRAGSRQQTSIGETSRHTNSVGIGGPSGTAPVSPTRDDVRCSGRSSWEHPEDAAGGGGATAGSSAAGRGRGGATEQNRAILFQDRPQGKAATATNSRSGGDAEGAGHAEPRTFEIWTSRGRTIVQTVLADSQPCEGGN